MLYTPLSSIIRCLESLGIQEFSIFQVQHDVEFETKYQAWLESGYYGKMEYLVRHKNAKYNPNTIWPEAKSILVIPHNYYRDSIKDLSPIHNGKIYGKISRYAWGKNYHKHIIRILETSIQQLKEYFPKTIFHACIDSTPLDERWLACKSGLGFFGYNTMFIHPTYGSWCFLGEIISSDNWPQGVWKNGNWTPTMFSDKDDITTLGANTLCRNCRRCFEACPTGALIAPYIKNSSHCISYLTIENRESIPASLRAQIGSHLFGCDVCQLVCPYNHDVQATSEPIYLAPSLPLEPFFFMQEKEFVQQYAGTSILRAKWRGILRNACVVAGNYGKCLADPTMLLDTLQMYATSENALLAEHAAWAIQNIIT